MEEQKKCDFVAPALSPVLEETSEQSHVSSRDFLPNRVVQQLEIALDGSGLSTRIYSNSRKRVHQASAMGSLLAGMIGEEAAPGAKLLHIENELPIELQESMLWEDISNFTDDREITLYECKIDDYQIDWPQQQSSAATEMFEQTTAPLPNMPSTSHAHTPPAQPTSVIKRTYCQHGRIEITTDDSILTSGEHDHPNQMIWCQALNVVHRNNS